MHIHVLFILAGLQWASAENIQNYEPVKAPLSFQTSLYEKPPWPRLNIVGGDEVTPHSHPHQVGLLVNVISPDNDSKKGGFCGGSLISDTWILTAAHCADVRVILGDPSGDTVNQHKLRITAVVGAHNYTDKGLVGRQSMDVVIINIHPKWDLFRLTNDIALLMLDDRVKIDKYVKPIRMPKTSQQSESFYNADVTMTGWGLTKRTNKKPSPVLRYVTSKVVSNFYCNFRYVFLLVKGTNICTSGSGWKGTCHGDSGGPLIVNEADGEPTLVGITSFGIGCSWGFPSVFTRVSSYLDWIHNTTHIPKRN